MKMCSNCLHFYYLVNNYPSAPCETCVHHDKWQTTEQTNGDRIRAMSDEKLAAWIEQLEPPKCPSDDWYSKCKKPFCDGCWLDWLRQKVEDNEL